MASPQVTFAPSASVTFLADAQAAQMELPPVDASNSSVVIQNLGPGTLGIVAGTCVGPVFQAPGCITLQPGEHRLMADPGLMGGTLATVQAHPPYQCRGTIMRGSTADVWLFSALGAEVM